MLEIKAKFVNTKRQFKWRLEYGQKHSDWYTLYSGLLVWKAPNNITYALATDYWNGALPIEKPFIIKEIEQEIG